jgi:hypothetical protein
MRIRGFDAGQFEALGMPLGIGTDHPDAGTFTWTSIGGKAVQRGTTEMIDQTDVARGLPYVYGADDIRFRIVTDDPAWAADAIRQLP